MENIFDKINFLCKDNDYLCHKVYTQHKILWLSNIKLKCKDCGCKYDCDKDEGVMCENCGSYIENDIKNRVEEIIFNENLENFNIIERKEITTNMDVSEIYKINLVYNSRTYYCVFLGGILYESNSWSSTPHTDIFKKWYIFMNPNARTKYYNETQITK